MSVFSTPQTTSEPWSIDEQGAFTKASLWKDAIGRLVANRLAVVGLVIMALLIVVALIGPYIAPYDALSQDLDARFQKPSTQHWLGTDQLGRDVFSRLLYGARTAVTVAFIATTISTTIGVALGSIAGYIGGAVDTAIVWLIDMTRSLPGLLIAVVVALTLRPPLSRWMEQRYLVTHNTLYRQTIWVDLLLMFGVLSLIQWPNIARLIRGQILSIRSRNYVLAARALGVPRSGILLRYVIPNAIGPLIVSVSAGFGGAMASESAFSFLGVGVPLQIPSWGRMIGDGLQYWRLAPHLLAGPGLFLGIVTIASAFLGDGLNDALNPRQWK